MVKESWSHNSIQTVIDGWNWDWLTDENKEKMLTWCNDRTYKFPEDKKTLIKWCKTLRGGKQIGLLGKEGRVKWFNWWEFELPGCNMHMNFKRIFSKGVGYRCHIKRINESSQEWKAFSVLERDTITEIAKRLDMKVFNLINFTRNRSMGLKPFLTYWERLGWLIRKDDKSSRWIFVDKEWENRVFKEFKEEGGIVINTTSNPKPRYHKVLYFLPKSHKDKPNCPGRPIQAWPRRKPRLTNLRKKLEDKINWFRNETEEETFLRLTSDEPVEKPGYMMKNTTTMYQELAKGTSRGVRGLFIKGDIKSMYNNIPREELQSMLKYYYEVGEKDIQRIFDLYYNSLLQFGNTLYDYTTGLDMGCPLSPVLAQLYIQFKLRNVHTLDIVQSLCVYLDDIGIRFVPGINEHTVDAVKSWMESEILPLEIEWGDSDGILDVTWSKSVEQFSTWFNNNEREFKLMLDTELPTNVKINSIIQQVNRAMIRDGYTYNFSYDDNMPLEINTDYLERSRRDFVQCAHRVQMGEKLWNEEIPGLFGDSELVGKLGDGLSKYANFFTHSDNEVCQGCYWGIKWSKWIPKEKRNDEDVSINLSKFIELTLLESEENNKKDNKDKEEKGERKEKEKENEKLTNHTYISLPWNPLLESKKGKRVTRKVMNKLQREWKCEIKIRWKPINTNVYRIFMFKDKRIPTNLKATDEYRGSDRNGLGKVIKHISRVVEPALKESLLDPNVKFGNIDKRQRDMMIDFYDSLDTWFSKEKDFTLF